MSLLSNDILKLRKVEPLDLPFLYFIENDDKEWENSGNHNPLSQKDLKDYIASSNGDIFTDKQLRLIVELKSMSTDSQTIGCVDLYDFEPVSSKAAVGIYIIPSQRGKGYASQSLKLIESYAFNCLNMRMLYAFVSSQNVSSLHLFESCGYSNIATLQSWLMTSDVCYLNKINPNFLGATLK